MRVGSSGGAPAREARRRSGGFALIEALIAFAIVSVALGTLLGGIAAALRGDRQAATRRLALRAAEARLERLGVAEPLEPGESEGVDDEGRPWRQTVTPVVPRAERGASATDSAPVTAYWVEVGVLMEDGKPLSLGAVKLAPTRPRPPT